MLLHESLPLPGYGDVDLGPDEGHAGGDEADVGQSLLHDDGGDVGVLSGVARHVDPLEGHRVPLVLPQRELPVELQVERVVGAHLDVLVLLDVAPLQPQHAGLGVEVDGLDADGERRADAVRRRRARGRLGLHLAHRRRPDRVPLGDEVVRVPHVLGFVGDEAHIPITNIISSNIHYYIIKNNFYR